jgi:hypothetical protein
MASDPPPASSPSPASTPPASGPPASGAPASGNTPASADTINQALDAVKTAFPPDSSVLADLRLDSNDDQVAYITMVLNDQPDAYGWSGVQPILDALLQQFQTLNIPQGTQLTYAMADASNPPASSPSNPGPASSPPASG